MTTAVLSQEKERNARRKKKKTPAAASEETAFPPAAEDEEMEASGASGNEEELAEETEGEVAVLGREGVDTHAHPVLCLPEHSLVPWAKPGVDHRGALTRLASRFRLPIVHMLSL